ncbi:MAG: hypothetical protein JO334_19840 [Verrucomicrobia bacterium]|nr:hypothetical protein [Verrucomicrobiota bacterium]
MRKTFLRSLVVLVGSSALALAITSIRAMAEDSNGAKTLTLDVAIDGSTLALNNNDPANPAVKGTTFTVTGKIFPGGTIPDGVTPFDPNQPGIGTWVCSGVFVADAADIFGGKAKIAFHTNQIFMLHDDQNALFTEGLEGSVGTTTHRIVAGGNGVFKGLVGQERQDTIGLNLNGKGLFDLHFTFKLEPSHSD